MFREKKRYGTQNQEWLNIGVYVVRSVPHNTEQCSVTTQKIKKKKEEKQMTRLETMTENSRTDLIRLIEQGQLEMTEYQLGLGMTPLKRGRIPPLTWLVKHKTQLMKLDPVTYFKCIYCRFKDEEADDEVSDADWYWGAVVALREVGDDEFREVEKEKEKEKERIRKIAEQMWFETHRN